jgi:hypothetical protein
LLKAPKLRLMHRQKVEGVKWMHTDIKVRHTGQKS